MNKMNFRESNRRQTHKSAPATDFVGGNAPCAAIGRVRPIRVYPLCGASIAGPATPRFGGNLSSTGRPERSPLRVPTTWPGGSRTAPTKQCNALYGRSTLRPSRIRLRPLTHKQCAALQGVWGNWFPHEKNFAYRRRVMDQTKAGAPMRAMMTPTGR